MVQHSSHCAVLGPVLYLLPCPCTNALSPEPRYSLSGFALSSQVQLGLRAGVLGTSSSPDYPSLPPSARESRAGCLHSPAPAVTAQPRRAEQSPPWGRDFVPSQLLTWVGLHEEGTGSSPGDPSVPVAPKQQLLHFPKAGLDPPEPQHQGKAPSSHPTLEQSLGRIFQS